MADPQQNPQTTGTAHGGQPTPPPQTGPAQQTQQGQQPQPGQQTQQAGGQPAQQMPPQVMPGQMQGQPGMMPPQGMPQGYYPYGMPMQNMGQPMPGMYQQMPQQPYPMYAPQGYPQPGMGQQGMPGAGTPSAGGFGDGFGGGGGTGGAQPQKLSNFKFGEWQKNFKTTIAIPAHNLKFDEAYFLKLLAGSISLTRDEKKRIIESVPKLRQQQVDELIRIFEEEKTKFIELSPKHGDQLEKLEKKHREDWRDLETVMVQQHKKEEDTAKADEIRKKLGLA